MRSWWWFGARPTVCVLSQWGDKRVTHVGGGVHHAPVSEGRNGSPVPVEGAFDLLVRGEFVVVS